MKVQGQLRRRSLTGCAHKKQAGHVSERSSNGVMEEVSGKVQKAGAHVGSFIVMDVAIVESHVAAGDVKTPALQNKEGKGHGNVIQRDDG